jgi:hypothetical protein
MGGADLGRSHKGEEDCNHKSMRQKWSPIRQQPTPRDPSSPHGTRSSSSRLSITRSRHSNFPVLHSALCGQPRSPPSGAATPTCRRSLPMLTFLYSSKYNMFSRKFLPYLQNVYIYAYVFFRYFGVLEICFSFFFQKRDQCFGCCWWLMKIDIITWT